MIRETIKGGLAALVCICAGPLSAVGMTPDTIRYAGTVRAEATEGDDVVMEKAARVVPTAKQLAALDNEFIAFVHFGPNTFTCREWGDGMEDPKVFDLKNLDTDQWCEAMKDAGMKMVILTAKHHDGFVLWQSRYTDHGIMSTDYKGGKGDVMKELSESCRKYGIKLGVYLSPADLYQIESPTGLYGNESEYTERIIPRPVESRPFADKRTFRFKVDDYNEYFLNQLFELLTEYGPIHEVWFDGAHPKRKGGQTYNYSAWRELIRTLAPEATIFGREDIRWCGNEAGNTREAEWNVIAPYTDDPRTLTEYRDLYGDLGTREAILGRERPFYLHYQPAEVDTSIRDGWFYRDEDHQRTRSVDDVFDIYERAVGGNAIFLLNIPPTRDGVFSPKDTEVLRQVGKRIKETYGRSAFANQMNDVTVLDGDVKEIVLTNPEPVAINRVMVAEDIAGHGERVETHTVDAWIDGQWIEVASAKNIGHKRILRFPEVVTDRIRLRVTDSRLAPAISHLSAHHYRQEAMPQTVADDPQRMASVGRSESDIELVDADVLTLKFKKKRKVNGFAYLPSEQGKMSQIVEGVVEVSDNGKKWRRVATFTFGNLRNDPSPRNHYFPKPVKARYLRILLTASSPAITAPEEINIL